MTTSKRVVSISLLVFASVSATQGARPLVAYFRNLVVLKGISRAETLSLLQKPIR